MSIRPEIPLHTNILENSTDVRSRAGKPTPKHATISAIIAAIHSPVSARPETSWVHYLGLSRELIP
jgi:hypothetical protein